MSNDHHSTLPSSVITEPQNLSYDNNSHTTPRLPPKSTTAAIMSFFRITLMRSAIGLPKRTTGVLKALGLRKRMRTVYHPVSPDVAGKVMKVKELVAVSEVEQALTRAEERAARRPDPGYYVEKA